MSQRPKTYGPKFGMGLDLSQPDQITEEEKESFKQTFESFTGRPHYGLNFWLDTRPDILKRYRN